MRLDRFLATTGHGTRSEVKKLLKQHLVTVNETVVVKGNTQIDPKQDIISYQGEIIAYQPYVYIVMNKPQGCVCATSDNCHRTVIDLINGYDNYQLFPVGRLDLDTTGLLIITNDGDFFHQLMAPKNNHHKVYQALVKGQLTNDAIDKFQAGLEIDGGTKCKPAKLAIIDYRDDLTKVEITLSEGKFHQVKRMVKAVGGEVVSLKRIRINNLSLPADLLPGQYRELQSSELFDLKSRI